MKACVVQELSGPDGMVFTDIDDVAEDGNHVVIDVRAAGVCFPDLLLAKGEYQLKLPPPFVPGMEAAGVVRSAPEGSGFRVGERVSAFGILGAYAEQVAVPAPNVMRSPAELDDAEAVSLLVNYNTMYFALARRAAMRPGDTVLVLGAAGGVGTAAIQVAQAMGAKKVLAVVTWWCRWPTAGQTGCVTTPTAAESTSSSTPSAVRRSMTRFACWRSTASCW
jgi:NADPH:quinone reductase